MSRAPSAVPRLQVNEDAAALDAFVEGRPFLHLVPSPEEVTLSSTVGTNRVVLGVRVYRRWRRLLSSEWLQ